jgi:hypothetical protein
MANTPTVVLQRVELASSPPYCPYCPVRSPAREAVLYDRTQSESVAFEQHLNQINRIGWRVPGFRRLSQPCPPCAKPSSKSSLDQCRGDVPTAENGFATRYSVNKSAKVVLGFGLNQPPTGGPVSPPSQKLACRATIG